MSDGALHVVDVAASKGDLLDKSNIKLYNVCALNKLYNMTDTENEKMTTRMIASTKAKNHFGRILDDIIQNHTRYVVKRRGAPQAIILSLSDFEQIIGDKHQQSRIGKVIRELTPEYNLGETISQE